MGARLRTAGLLGVATLLTATATISARPLGHAEASATGKKVCKTVTKKVHGHKKKVKFCHTVKVSKPTATPTATPVPPLADVSGSGQNLNDGLILGIVLGPSYFCCFEQSRDTFLAPAHFQVDWTVSCQLAPPTVYNPSTFFYAQFYVVGYDGTYQYEELYSAVNVGGQSGTTTVDTTSTKRWAFVVSDADKAQCSYHLVAKQLGG